MVCLAAVSFPFPDGEVNWASEEACLSQRKTGRSGEGVNFVFAFARCFVPFACFFGNACDRRLGKNNIQYTVNLHLPLTIKLNMAIVNYCKMYVSN